MSKLDRVVVPMPQFVNPNNAKTNSGSINLSLDAHPVEHAEGYGAEIDEHVVHSPADVDSISDDTSNWTKDDFKKALGSANLAVSGNKDELEARWNDHLEQKAKYAAYTAEEWESDIAECDSEDDLATLEAAFEATGADMPEVTAAFEAKKAEL